MQLEDFINKNREKALSLNIEGYPEINNVLQKQKLRPSKEFIKKAIEELESNLINCLVRNNHLSDKSKTPIYLLDIRLLLEYRQLQKEGLRFYVLAHFPRWLGKSPLYFENIRPELLGFIEALETHFADVKINSFTMDWVLNMTPLGIRKKLKKIQEAKDEMEFIIWENKVLQTIREASDDEILYYALRMYLEIKDHPFAETPKPQQNENPEPIELPKGFEKFAIKEDDKPLILKIYNAYKNIKGKDIAILIFVLHKEGILTYEKRKNNSRKALMQCFNPNIKDDVYERRYFNTAKDNDLYTKDNKPGTSYVYPDEVIKVEKSIKELVQKHKVH